jgi:hypothetical protein
MKVTGRLGMLVLALVVGLPIVGELAPSSTRADETAPTPIVAGAVDAEGNLRVPTDYRSTYQFLGSWAVAAEEGKGAGQLHVVYASPGTIAAYNETGRFLDGTVLVKEVFEASTEEMATGTVSHEQTLKGWFVMVKDSKNSHPGNKLWGNGWGWSWFDAVDPLKTTSTDFKSDCLSCHVPANASDWIYVGGYPGLKKR